MTLTLTPQQSDALRSETGPVRLRDPVTNSTYVLVREEAMLGLQSLFADGPLSPAERETILRGVWKRANWDGAALDDHSNLASTKY